MISTCRTTTANVKNWQSGEMRRRWCAAGMLEAERSFRRIKGYKEIGQFIKKLRNKLADNPKIVIPPTYSYRSMKHRDHHPHFNKNRGCAQKMTSEVVMSMT